MRAKCVLLMVMSVAAGVSSQPVQAIYLSESGVRASLSGPIEPGDEKVFEQFLGKPRPARLSVIYLNSIGGSLEAGIGIGRLVRKARLTTAVIADSEQCDSACTMVFAGGVKRHYVNGDKIFAGFTAMSGLGYHPVHRHGNRISPNMKAHEATDLARRFFAEMGQPAAGDLADRAGINTLFRPSGEMALRLNIATSLASPLVAGSGR